MYKKILIPLFLLCCFFTISLADNICNEFGDPPDPSRFVKGNWNHIMDPHGCVILDPDNGLLIYIKITVAVSDLSVAAPIYYTTQFHNGPQSSLIGPILNSHLVPEELPSGQIVYTFTDRIYFGEFHNECTESPNEPTSFDYNVTLRDENGNLYPIEDYASILTPAYISGVDKDGNAIIPSITYSGTNNLCCYGSTESEEAPNGRFTQHTTPEIDASEQLATVIDLKTEDLIQESKPSDFSKDFTSQAVFPNPFKDVLNIKFPGISNQSTIIQVWDIKGRLIQEAKHRSDTSQIQQTQINTKKLDAGFYYCRIKNDVYTHTFKVLKVDK